MDLGIREKVALVLASSQGLGKACALSLAREGTHVAICARRPGPLEDARREVQAQASGRVVAIQADITDPKQAQALVARVTGELGRIDILITNSGPPPSGLFFDLSPEQWQQALDSLMMATVRICYLTIPGMRERKWGRIVHITSTSVKQPLGHLMLSSAARMGIVGLSKMTANQFAADNVLINTVCPGPFLTEAEIDFFNRMALERGITPEQAQHDWVRDIPIGRVGDPREFADVVTFLASERASYVTGTVIQVDGGRVQSML